MSSKSVNELIKEAGQQGMLSGKSASALAIPDIGQNIQEAMGIDVSQVQASEVVLITLMIDDSGSIRFAGHSQTLRDGHNQILEALKGAKQHDHVLVHCRYLNGEILYAYDVLDKAIQMTDKNYDPDKGTPLFDESVALLKTVLAKSQEFARQGIPVRTVTCIVTDGADMHSHHAHAAEVESIIKDMLKQETHIICGMGVDSGEGVNFSDVFKSMGIRDEWILTPGNSAKEIRKAFRTVSDSAVACSQSAKSFTQAALGGGFNTP